MDFIKKLIGGFFSFLIGLFKGAKKSEYFLELDDARGVKSESQPSIPPVQPQIEPAKAEAASPTPVEANGKASPAPVAKTTEIAPAADTAPPTKVASAPQSAVVSSSSATTFAPDFLLSPSSSNGRRRPGPSLNRFLDMAKQVNPS